MTDFQWELQAAHGEEMPDGLPQHDQLAYLSLMALHKAYKDGKIGKEKATAEKQKILREWTKAKATAEFADKLAAYREQVNRLAEKAVSECRKNPTQENALKLCDVLDGIGFVKGDSPCT